MSTEKFIPKVCECCKRTDTYLLSLDHGSAVVVRAIYLAVRAKGVNMVHPRKEIESSDEDEIRNSNGAKLSSNEVGNLSRPRFHGLIAKVKGHRGYYCITRKGGLFLNNHPVPRRAIISKVEGRQVGYHPDAFSDTVRMSDLLVMDPYWIGPNEHLFN